MSAPRILDAAATLALQLGGTKLVEASAGTGKTYAIGNLYLKMVLAGYRAGEILVVTYTNAATEELRGRIRLRIYQALTKLEQEEGGDEYLDIWAASLTSDAERDKAIRRLKLALSSMDEAAIYTIHAFCQRALSEHAFNSRQPFDVEMITDDSLLWSSSLKDWWRINTYRLNERDLQLLYAALGSVEKLIELQTPLRKPHVRLMPEPAGSIADILGLWQELEQQSSAMAEVWRRNREALVATLESDAFKRQKNTYKLGNLPGVFDLFDAWAGSDRHLDLPENLQDFGETALTGNLKKNQQEAGIAHPFFAAVDALLEKKGDIEFRFKVASLADAHAFAAAQVAGVKERAGQFSFDDQLVMLERAVSSSEELAATLRRRFPVAMIDEFQDTDATQYAIFSRLYRGTDGCLIMIGDPKQAIYGFRGGDIFTYIHAKLDADEHLSLATNWRSTAGLIRAVNAVFAGRGDPFIHEAIPFMPVAPASVQKPQLLEQGREGTPMTLWRLPAGENGKPLSNGAAASLLHACTANEIARLLNGSRCGELMLGEQPVRPGDIAVLVRNHIEAHDLREELRRRGIPAVASGSRSVFESEEAEGLRLLLEAVIDYRDAGLLRQAMSSSLLGYSYAEVHDRIRDEHTWLEWCEHFQKLHEAWIGRGFMAMFQRMLRSLEIGEKLAASINADRRLTNLLHLGELLLQAHHTITGMDALLHWFHQQLESTALTESELRLENDGDLVRIVTIHASKGLEYPIVFAPYLWNCKEREAGKGLVPFFDEVSGRHCLDISDDAAHLRLSDKERLAEDVRLAYVALTRACARLYMAWGRATNSGATALGWLLHGVQKPADLDTARADVFAHGAELDTDLGRLVSAAGGTIDMIELSHEADAPVMVETGDAQGTGCMHAVFSGTIPTQWRISSFSSLTRDVHQVFSLGARIESDDPVFNLPAGSQTGLFLHSLFEELDFCERVREQVADFTRRQAGRFGLDADISPIIETWVLDLLETPLDDSGLCLRQVPIQHRLNELAFDFSITALDIGVLNRTLEDAAGRELQPLGAESLRGLITGIIDLVFEHKGRFYIADYKSNHLGYSLDAYAPEPLKQAVFDRRYDLQYLIYTLALHRYLKQRLPDYSYESHFGGVYYLFLRGMRSSSGSACGIHFDRPALALIEKLDEEIFSPEEGR